MSRVLNSCGNDLPGENILNVARNLKGVQLPLQVPGITLDTSPTDHYLIEQLQLTRIEKALGIRSDRSSVRKLRAAGIGPAFHCRAVLVLHARRARRDSPRS